MRSVERSSAPSTPECYACPKLDQMPEARRKYCRAQNYCVSEFVVDNVKYLEDVSTSYFFIERGRGKGGRVRSEKEGGVIGNREGGGFPSSGAGWGAQGLGGGLLMYFWARNAHQEYLQSFFCRVGSVARY